MSKAGAATILRRGGAGIAPRAGRAAALLAAAFALWTMAAAPSPAAEVIERFNANVLVHADGVLEVLETIVVKAEGDRIKRGIFRDFPLTFLDDQGTPHRVSFTLLGVEKNGKPEPYHTTSNSAGIRIYAGEESVFLPSGVYRYRIHYKTGRQVRFLPDHTELFWNVTGNDWAFPILEARARIALPDGAAPVRWTAYTGRYGERGQDFTGRILGSNALEVTTTRALRPEEGFSVVVEIPPGAVSPPSGMQALYYRFLDNRPLALGGLGFIGVLAFYLFTWSAVGRDPPKGTIIPLFHPPRDVSPALAGYVRDWGWAAGGWRAFTAAAISLAVKGLIVFDESGGSITLKATEAAGGADRPGLPPGERAIFDWVKRKGEVTIDKANGPGVASAFAAFKDAIEKENRNRFFKRNLGYFALGAAFTVVAIAAVVFFGNLRDQEIALLFVTGFVGVVGGVFVIPVIRSLFGPHSPRSIVAIGINLVGIVIIGSTFLSIFGASNQSLPDDFAYGVLGALTRNGFPFLLVGGFAALNGLFYYLLRAPTAAGRAMMDRIEGLELYIRTAETARLNLAGAPDLSTTQFERLLPYAIALNAEKPWSEAFAAAFARAHPGDDLTHAYAPVWHGGQGWAGDSFGRSLSSSISSAQGSFQSSVPAPTSSSSGFSGGGGGGSGGGGGGGGGGGW